jgi:uncharacterized membrane protein
MRNVIAVEALFTSLAGLFASFIGVFVLGLAASDPDHVLIMLATVGGAIVFVAGIGVAISAWRTDHL